MLGFIDLSKFALLLEDSGVNCGLFHTGTDGMQTIANLTSGAVLVIQIFVPVVLVIMGMVDMGKAVMQQKEDDIKKAEQVFVTRLIAAVITFLIITIVKLVISVLAGASNNNAVDNDSNGSFMQCFNFFLTGKA